MTGGAGPTTVVVDDRIADRRREVREQRRRRRLRRTVLVVALLALAALAAAVERSDLVALEEVRVAGTERLEPDVVREAAALELGTSTLRLRLGAAERRVEELPLVLSADARREDPLTVTVTVRERQPYALATGRGGPVLVDRDGLVIDRGIQDDLPLIELSGRVPAPGASVDDHAGLAAAFTVLRGLPGPLRTEVVRYEVDADAQLVLVLDRGTRVAFGGPDRVIEKARSLGAVLEDVGDTPVAVIDVRAPSTPTVRR